MYYVLESGKKNAGALGSAFEAPTGLVGVLAADSVASSPENSSASLSEDMETRNTARPLIWL